MTGIDALISLAIVLLLLMLILLAIAETSLNRISRVKAEALVATTSTKSARALQRLVTHPERFINPVLVTVTFLQTGQAFLTSILADRLFGPIGIVAGFLLNVVVFFVLAEAMPKTWAVLSAERAALMTARPTEYIVSFPPLRLISRGLIGLTNVLLPGKGLKEGPFVSEQELLGIVHAAAQDDVIEHEERRLIESIIEFGDTVAREVMVPRPDMEMVPQDATVTQALDVLIEHGYSRVPIMNYDSDVVGLAYTKDLIRAERTGSGEEPVSGLARLVRFIPENKPVSALMREMQAEHFHLAIVADEYGAVTGLITLEDCLEELVGEIVDEYDEEEAAIQRAGDREWLVVGAVQISDLNDVLDLELPNEDWDTLGGFVFGTLGHVPQRDEVVECDGWQFVTLEVENRRIRQVRVVAPEGHVPRRSDEYVFANVLEEDDPGEEYDTQRRKESSSRGWSTRQE